MLRLDNKVALITGAASGIGFGIAKAYAAAGASIAMVDLDLANCEAAAVLLHKENNSQIIALQADVTDEQAINAAVTTVVEKFGRLDIVNCNAGIQIINSFAEFEYRQWQKIIDVHLNGSFLLSKAAMRQMLLQETGGTIIVTGSVHSFLASKEKAAYVAAKHAQLGLVRAIAKEGGPHNVRANLIAPGFVLTPLVEKQIPEQAQAFGISEEEVIKNIMLKDTVDGKFTTIEDVARVSLFLASFPSNALTGQSIIISNGWHMD